jgi:integrase/recombinase XerD
MRVVEIETQDRQKRYVVTDDEGVLVEPIVRYLKYLDRIGAARNTLRSYATVLKQYWDYLSQQQLEWQQVTLDDLAQFVLWLKLPTGSLHVLPAQPVPQARSNRTINHALTVLSSFYNYQPCVRLDQTPAQSLGSDSHTKASSPRSQSRPSVCVILQTSCRLAR